MDERVDYYLENGDIVEVKWKYHGIPSTFVLCSSDDGFEFRRRHDDPEPKKQRTFYLKFRDIRGIKIDRTVGVTVDDTPEIRGAIRTMVDAINWEIDETGDLLAGIQEDVK